MKKDVKHWAEGLDPKVRAGCAAHFLFGYFFNSASQAVMDEFLVLAKAAGVTTLPAPSFEEDCPFTGPDAEAPDDTPDDQFTGSDLGAQMAAAEAAFNHSSQVAERGQRVRLLATGLVGQVDEVSTSPDGWSYLVKLDDGGYAWKLGDDFELVA